MLLPINKKAKTMASLYLVALDVLQKELKKYNLPCITPKYGKEYGIIQVTTKIKKKQEKLNLFISMGMYKKGGGQIQGNINIPMLRYQMQSAIRKLLKKHDCNLDVDEDLIQKKVNAKYDNRIKSPKCKNDILKKDIFNQVRQIALYNRWQQSDQTWEKWLDKLITTNGDKILTRLRKEIIIAEFCYRANVSPEKKPKLKKATPYVKKSMKAIA